MEKTQTPNEARDQEFKEWLETLPKETINNVTLHLYQGRIWCPTITLKHIQAFQNDFRALDTDVILSSAPKAGTTWLKALSFAILNRSQYSIKEHPLLTSSPHDLIPLIEFNYPFSPLKDDQPKDRSCPRFVATHLPYESLPPSIRTSNCKIVCVCRNPLDMFISYWHFSVNFSQDKSTILPLEEQFDVYFRGVHAFGPTWDNVLGYWKVSKEKAEKVLVLKYEDMKKDIVDNMKKMAEFLGVPFSEEEEKGGAIEEIAKLCSFENLKDMDVNKGVGTRKSGLPNSAFFRKGQVGDWTNHLSPEMAECAKKIIQEKLSESGLTFDM